MSQIKLKEHEIGYNLIKIYMHFDQSNRQKSDVSYENRDNKYELILYPPIENMFTFQSRIIYFFQNYSEQGLYSDI